MAKANLKPWIFDLQNECLDVEQLRKKQWGLLERLTHRVAREVPFYRDAWNLLQIDPREMKSVEDFHKLPCTYKSDLREAYPLKMAAMPLSQIRRLHASSGTTGNPTVVAYTDSDLKVWSELVARALAAAGVKAGTILQNAYGYGIFTGGMGFHGGAERLGALLIPSAMQTAAQQIRWLKDLGTEVLLCTPSAATHIVHEAVQMGVDLKSLPVSAGVFGGESWSEKMRQRLEDAFNIKAYNTYGLSEIIGPGVASECEYRQGLHLYEDHFYAEIIDPETERPVSDGEWGELVLTTMTREASPVLRYRTQDLTRWIDRPCPCGRSLRRLDRLRGRLHEAIAVRRVFILPHEIESVLLSFSELSSHYRILVHGTDLVRNPQVEIEVEVSDKHLLENSVLMQNLQEKVIDSFRTRLDLEITLSLLAPKTLFRHEGKAERLVRRKQDSEMP